MNQFQMGQIMQNIKSGVTRENMKPLIHMTEDEKQALDIQFQNVNIPTNEEIMSMSQMYNLKPESFFYLKKDGFNLTPFFYYEFPVSYDLIFLFMQEDIHSEYSKKVLNHISEEKSKVKEEFENQNYMKFISLSHEVIADILYEDMMKSIPDEYKYAISMKVYTRKEYGFDQWNQSFLENVLSTKTDEDEKEKQERLLHHFPEGVPDKLTIYRGEADLSTPYEEALSWTLSKEKAIYFAERYGYQGDGVVYEAIVETKNIIDFLTHRGELEILVESQHLLDVKEV